MITIPPYTFVPSEELSRHPLLRPIEKAKSAPQPDLFHRIQKVCEENARDYLTGQHSQHIQAIQEAEQRYAAIDAQLCAACGRRPPLFSFYDFSLGKGGISIPLQSPRGIRRTRLQQETLAAILEANLKIQCPNQAVKTYLQDLQSLLRSLNLSPWEKLLRQHLHLRHSQTVHSFNSLYVSTEFFDGHLVYLPGPIDRSLTPSHALYTAYPISHLSYENTSIWSEITRAQRRALFAALKEEQKTWQAKGLTISACSTVPSSRTSLDQYDLLFCSQDQACAVRYDKDQGKLIPHTSPVGYAHTQKFIPLVPTPTISTQGPDFLDALFLITGGHEAAIDAFAKLLAGIAAPTPRKKQLWVVYTKHNRALIREILYQAFEQKAFGSIPPVLRGKRSFKAPPPPPKRPRAFLSTLLQANRLPVLLSAQVQGMSLILADDKFPTPTQELLLRNLTQGKKISVQDEYDATLSFRNQMHIVYVTDDEALSKKLTQSFQATLVDLSPYELQADQPDPLTRSELWWIQHNLFLYGCLCTHGPKPRKKPAKESASKTSTYVDQSIQAFLDHQCCLGPDLRCSRDQLYEAYADYCRRVYGQEPTDTPIRIMKKIRSQLPKDVVYKVARCGPENKSLSCFMGLGLQPTPYTPDPAPQEEEAQNARNAFRSYLEKIQDSVKGILPDLPYVGASLSRPDLTSKPRPGANGYLYNPPTAHHNTAPPPPPPPWNPPY